MSLMLSCSLSDSRVSSPPLLSANLAGAWPLGVREIGSDQRLTYCVFRDQRCAIRYRLCVQSDMGREKKKRLQASSRLRASISGSWVEQRLPAGTGSNDKW